MTSSTAVKHQAPTPSTSSSAPSPQKKTCTRTASLHDHHHHCDDILRSAAVFLDRQDSPATNHSTVSATNVIDMVDEAMAEITTTVVVSIDQRNEEGDEFQEQQEEEDILVPLKGWDDDDEDDDEAASLPRPTKRRSNKLRRKTRSVAAAVPTSNTLSSPTRAMYKQELLMDDMTGLELAFRSFTRANASNNRRTRSVQSSSDETLAAVDPDQEELALGIEDDILSVGDVEEKEEDFDGDFFGEDGLLPPRTTRGFTSSQVRDLVRLHGLRRTSV
eukprot:CAMPEP_0113459534 /NCGR_PEP_ID=MMETSP0014_2-20120614/10505_1 /TAXON_ID=2857 /ORGANISM="Nitzschia sp." /LENGTH=274 /DNA_ID=CAMNT_0000351127 /DNA_START=97 /DNA_END=921 /DNA_ORIENTATION=+ /assembly_acc=CAM_ASM_000159